MVRASVEFAAPLARLRYPRLEIVECEIGR
jgi:hypothetical protein